jgi:hypothetical protein
MFQMWPAETNSKLLRSVYRDARGLDRSGQEIGTAGSGPAGAQMARRTAEGRWRLIEAANEDNQTYTWWSASAGSVVAK